MIDASCCTAWMFHYVFERERTRFPNLKGLAPVEFSQFLDWVVRRGPVIHPAELIASIDGVQALPANAQLLTFDDGLQDHYRWVFPELLRRGLSGLFFVTTGTLENGRLLRVHRIHALQGMKGYRWLQEQFLSAAETSALRNRLSGLFADVRARLAYPYDDEGTAGFKYAINYLLPALEVDAVLDRILADSFDESALAREFYMSRDQLMQMADAGMHIGHHGHTHRPFSALSITELAAEMNASNHIFGEMLAKNPVFLSYPHGDASSITEEHVAQLPQWGIKAAFLADQGNLAFHRLHLPRVDIKQWQNGAVR